MPPNASYELQVWIAMRLAKDVDTCCALLRGEVVDPTGLDQKGLEWANSMGFVSLNTTAISFFALLDSGSTA